MDAEPRTAHGSGPARRAAAVVVVMVLAAALALVTDLGLRRPPTQPVGAEPVDVAPPPGLDLPRGRTPDPVAATPPPTPLRPRAVGDTLDPFLGDGALGRHVVAAVEPLEGNGPTWRRGAAGDVATPASTTKLFTTSAALLALGPDHRFTTRVVATGARSLVLVGGGDPLLASQPPAPDPSTYPQRADVVTLADRTAAALRDDHVRRVRLAFDDSLFSGPDVSPQWPATYVPEDVVSPVHALWVDEGRDASGPVADPAATAAAVYADALRADGVQVTGSLSRADVGERARTVASVTSAPLAGIVERVLEVSDNEASEVLLRHVGLASGGEGSFLAGQAGVRQVLGRAGIDLADPEVLYDGSGLSRENRVRPTTLVELLRLAASDDVPDLRPVVTGLSVAGYLGSLSDRFDTGDQRAPGRLRAKTGTLTNVFALAGLVTGTDGAPVVFALMADRIKVARTAEALTTMDEAAAALAGCRCAR